MAWELGGNMGHIDRMLLVARELRVRGHEAVFVLKDLSRAHDRVVAAGFTVLQAPVWLPRMVRQPPLSNFCTVLAAAGWLDVRGLCGLLSAWRALFDLVRPDLLMCDHAPTAMLAARGRTLPVATVGNGFQIPPVGEHFPALRYWDASERARCAQSDATLLPNANQALALLGDAPMPRLTALFSDVCCIIASLPELLHYPDYPASVHIVGPSFVADQGVAPQWPAGDGPRVFVYLSPEHADFVPLMLALRDGGYCTLVHAKGLSPELAQSLAGPSIRFESSPVKAGSTVRAARIVITHASIGTVSAAALAGCVQLALPNHMEQYMVARRMVDAGIGLAIEPGSRGTDFGAVLRRLLDDRRHADAAAALAARHRDVDADATGAQVADRLEGLLG